VVPCEISTLHLSISRRGFAVAKFRSRA